MPYVLRNNDDVIVALSRQSFNIGRDEQLDVQHPEVQAFLNDTGPVDDNSEKELSFLSKSDLELSRILEDLIELLIDKNHIIFTELPQQAQQKLLSRRRARASLHGHGLLSDSDTI